MKFQPAGRARFAGLLWIAVSVMLVARAWPYFAGMETSKQAMLAVASLIIGGAKGLFVLSKSSKRLITRIEGNPGSQWVWTIWPPVFLVLIAIMIGGGLALRHFIGATYPSVVVVVYFGVGAALLTSSLPFFKAASRMAAGQPAMGDAAPAAAEATETSTEA